MVEVIDKTGELRSDKDLEEAIDVVEDLMKHSPMALPKLVINLPNIRELLIELRYRRKGEIRGDEADRS